MQGQGGYGFPGPGAEGFGRRGQGYGGRGNGGQGYRGLGRQDFEDQDFGDQAFGDQGFGGQGLGRSGLGRRDLGQQGFGGQAFAGRSIDEPIFGRPELPDRFLGLHGLGLGQRRPPAYPQNERIWHGRPLASTPQIDLLFHQGINDNTRATYQSLPKKNKASLRQERPQMTWIMCEIWRQKQVNADSGVAVEFDFVVEEWFRRHPHIEEEFIDQGIREQQIGRYREECEKLGVFDDGEVVEGSDQVAGFWE